MSRLLVCVAAVSLSCAAAPALAQFQSFSVAPIGGTTGFGAQVGISLTSYVGVRAMATGLSLSRKITESDIDYDANIKIGGAQIVADWHPFGGVFRLSAGLGINNSKATFSSRGGSATITVNGVSYNATDLGTLDGKLDFGNTSPYLGFGWGSKPGGSKGLFFSSDIGVAFIRPTASLSGTCSSSLPAPTCTQLQADLASEEQQFKKEVESYNYYPVVTLGIGYRF